MIAEFANNYYHFTIEVLPEILKNKEVFVPNDFTPPDFIYQYEEILNLSILCLLNAATNQNLTNFHSYPPKYDLAHLKFLRELVLERDTILPKRIYISRSKAKRRQIVNEGELIEELLKCGFKILHLEDYSIIEQIKFFRNAEIVMAPHGAGLTNLIYCKENIKVIELKRNKEEYKIETNYVDYINCFLELAKICFLDYKEYFLDIERIEGTSVAHCNLVFSKDIFKGLSTNL